MERRDPDTFVTGGTGLIGRWLLAALTARGRRVVTVVRNAQARAEELHRFVAEHGGDPQRLQIVEGDLRRDDLGVELPTASVRDVFHCAGLYAWRLSEAEARAVNVEGSARVARWAAALPALRRLVYLGGYRMTRIPDWIEPTSPLPPAVRTRMYRELGAYEASKIEAQFTMRTIAKTYRLPLTIVSPATVIGDSRTGETTQYTGVAESVAMLWRGQMPAGAGNERTFVPLVPVDHLAEVMVTAVENPQTAGQELVVLDPDTPPLPELLAFIADHLGVAAPRFNLPVGLVRALPERLTGVVPETLSFLSEDHYDVSTARAHATTARIRMPPRVQATRRWVDFMVSTRFGEVPDAEPGRFVPTAGSQTFVVGDPEHADTLLLHGLPWDSESWHPLARQLGDVNVRPDIPGLGRSSATPTDALEWLHELLHARTRPIRIIAHSWGAGLALRYAVSSPDQVESLVMISPYFMQARASAPLRCAALGTVIFRHAGSDRLQRELLGHPGPPADAVQSAVAQLRRPGVARQTARALSAASRPAHRHALQAQLNELDIPCLIVHGSRDPLLQPMDAPIVTIAEAGHNPHLTHPSAVAEAITRWRQSLVTQAAPQREHPPSLH